MSRFCVFLLISTFLISTSGWAVEAALSWTEFVARASQANEELKASERNLQSLEYQSKGAYSPYFPQLSATISATQGPANEYSVSLTATQNIFAGFDDEAKLAQSRARLEIARVSLQSTQAKVSYDLKSALASLLYAENYVKLSQSIIERRELNLKMIQLSFDGGRENKGSLLLSKAYLEEARLDHLEALQALKVVQAQLAQALGEKDGEEGTFYSLRGSLPLSEPKSEMDLDFKKIALETPSYKTAIAQEDLSRATVTRAEANFYPALNLTANNSQYGPSWYPEQNKWSVGASLVFPLFNGGRDYFATREALESLKSSQYTKNSVQKDQLAKLKAAFFSFAQSVQKFKVDQAYVEAAEVREKISRQKYNNGLTSFNEWDLIENDLISRQKSLLVSEKNRVLSEAAWEQVQGKGVLL
ncbi:MAG: TolC family protein [Pseudobdellovibrionaceae bacterium]